MDKGRIQGIDDQKTDRGEYASHSKDKKKIDWIVVLMIISMLLVGFGVGGFILFGEKKERVTITNTEIDETTIRKEDDGVNSIRFYQENLRKTLAEQKENKESKEAELLVPDLVKETELPIPDLVKETKLPETDLVKEKQSKEKKVDLTQLRLSSSLMILMDEGKEENKTNAGVDFGFGVDQSLDNQLFKAGSAKLTGGQDFILKHGTNIPCALVTEIISTFKGLVVCSVINDIYSANGVTLLIEKGSKVFGTQDIAVEQGQSRLFLKWGDVQTPNSISIQINSLGAGPLGASGVDAWIDNHYKERFGGAILLSFLDDTFSTISNSKLKDAQFSTENTQANMMDMAGIALENTINIPPTGYVTIGTRLNIIVARDVDMSNVYQFSK